MEIGFLAEAADSVALVSVDGSDCSRLLLFAVIVTIAYAPSIPDEPPKMLRLGRRLRDISKMRTKKNGRRVNNKTLLENTRTLISNTEHR